MKSLPSLMDIIEARKSIRNYKPQPVEEEKLQYVLQAFRKAPSAKNIQPWKLIVVRDLKKKNDLAIACNNQTFIADAPIIIVACANEKEAYGVMGGYMSSFSIDVAIALEHLMLAAAEIGLGTCWIGSFKEKLVKDLMGIPDNIRVVALTPLGYPSREPGERGRKPLSEIVCFDRYIE
ncbi:MAG: nitroreductase family protein [Actinomycetota bacterium]|nr:nitroreductase family protein [Actinomycetota bacterium]